MVVVRATKKVLRSLPEVSESVLESTTALGDWYVNRITVDRQPLLILVSSASLLSILVPARDVKSLPERLPYLVGARLHRLGISANDIKTEMGAMLDYSVAPTVSRSIVGTMIDFGKVVPVYLPVGNWDEVDLYYAESQLESTPSHLPGEKRRFIHPGELARQLVEENSISRRTSLFDA